MSGYEIGFTIAMVTLALISAYAYKLKSLLKELNDVYVTYQKIKADGDVKKEEMMELFNEVGDVLKVGFDIIQLFIRKRP